MTEPSARTQPAMAYDPRDGYVVLFGGGTNNGPSPPVLNDTWTFRGGNWTQLKLSVAPSPRFEASLTWDPSLQALLLFGGVSGGTTFGDTWEFSLGRWSPLHPAMAPTPRWGAGLAYSSLLNETVLFGGEQAGMNFNDTWTFANGSWALLPQLHAPSSRTLPIMATDPVDGSILLFGGEAVRGVIFGDDWKMLRSGWVDITSLLPQEPPPLADAGVAFNRSSNESLLMFGGFDATVYYGLTWTFEELLETAIGTTPSALDEGVPAGFIARILGGSPPYRTSWVFGDGAISNATSPEHTFLMSGVYSVTLTVHDAVGVGAISFFQASVASSLRLSAYAANPLVEAGQAAGFDSQVLGGSPPITLTWRFGDGVSSTQVDPQHVFEAAGTYEVALFANDTAGASAATVVTERVLAGLGHSLKASTMRGTAPLNVSFEGNATGGIAPYSFAWTFSDGGRALGALVSHVFRHPGYFEVALWTNDSSSGSSEETVLVNVSLATIATPPFSDTVGLPSQDVLPLFLIATFLGALLTVCVRLGWATYLTRLAARLPEHLHASGAPQGLSRLSRQGKPWWRRRGTISEAPTLAPIEMVPLLPSEEPSPRRAARRPGTAFHRPGLLEDERWNRRPVSDRGSSSVDPASGALTLATGYYPTASPSEEVSGAHFGEREKNARSRAAGGIQRGAWHLR